MSRIAFLAFVLLALSGFSVASVTVSSPLNGATVSSQVHVVAAASSSYPISAMRIYVDGNSAYITYSAKIDTYLTLAAGGHSVTVSAWDSSGALQKQSLNISVSGSGSAVPSTATTFSRIEDMPGWEGCSGCAGAGGQASYTMQQGISLPSLDGDSAQFNLGGTVPWSHALFHRWMSSNGSATNFVYDVNYYFKNPNASSGLEFSMNQAAGTQWYRWDWQCSYLSGIWRIWDGANAKWINTAVACARPSGYTWTHVQFQGKRVNGQTLYVALVINGQTYYINRAVGPTPLSSPSYGVTVRFQLNGDAVETDYSVWGDRFSLTYW